MNNVPVMSCESQTKPLQLRFSNVTLTNDGLANLNGIAMQFGSPGQIIALTPSTLMNNTVVTNRESCGSDANSSCIQSIGGGFDPSKSSSFGASTADAWNGSVEADIDLFINQRTTYLNDELTVAVDQSSQSLSEFPLLLWNKEASIYSELGLGRNSTFINRLAEARLIPSRSWSFFAGVYSQIRAGSLIVGGYADRFYQGTLRTSNVSEFCDVCFELTHMNYQQDGLTFNLLPEGKTVTAIIDPYYPANAVSDSIFYKWGNITNGTLSPVIWNGIHTYSSDVVPTGNVTITLANGLTTTIPNKALFYPPAYDNGMMAPYRADSTVYGLFARSSTDSKWIVATATEETIVLGMPYVAMIYLVRDFERQTVGIANANQEAQIGGSATTICPVQAKSSTMTSNTGVTVGAIIGGIAGLGLIIFIAWSFWRKSKEAAASNLKAEAKGSLASEIKPELPASGIYSPAGSSFGKPVGSVVSTQELSSESTKFEMPENQPWPLQEMPSDDKIFRSELPAWTEHRGS